MAKPTTKQTFESLLQSGDWMIRFDYDGKSYNGFDWKPIGRWTTAPDWNPEPKCGHGLHGQSPRGAGYCQTGNRLVLCKTKEQIVIDGDKVKTPSAKILAVNQQIPAAFLEISSLSLDLRDYQHPLPKGLTTVGGYLYLHGYSHPLPEGLTTVGGALYLGNYQHPLPEGLRKAKNI